MTAVDGPRKPGRPKGSTNKRTKDFKGYMDARYGASAALQLAALCMVTPAELKAAGNSMARAQVDKALDLVRHVRDARDRLDQELQAMVREALEDVAQRMLAAQGKELRAIVAGFVREVRQLGGDFGLREAMTMMATARAELLPYTDQRQPQAVDVALNGGAPSVVIMGAAPAMANGQGAEMAGLFEGVFEEVSQPKSHDEGEAPEFARLPAPDATD